MAIRNICNCPSPPGGSVECSKDQMALCIVENGTVRRVCQNVVKDKDDSTIVNFALSIITGEIRPDYNNVSDYDIQILQSGEFYRGNVAVTFNLPEVIIKAVRNIDRGRGLAR